MTGAVEFETAGRVELTDWMSHAPNDHHQGGVTGV